MKKIISQCIFYIRNHTLLKIIAYKLLYSWRKDASKKQGHKIKAVFRYPVDLENPRSFNEYILWLKRNYRNNQWKECADKLKCKDFLKRNGFEKYLPKTLAIYDSSSQIDLSNLPNKFVLKTNHDCGSVYICEKGKTNFGKVFKSIDKSLKQSYYSESDEWVYEDIEPKIYAEEYLEPKNGKDLNDFKLFTFDGKYRFGYYSANRSKDVRFQLFENDFDIVNCDYSHLRPGKKYTISKPDEFPELVRLAEQVGQHFNFVRVDLYLTTQGIKLGELTFLAMSGFGQFIDYQYDFKYGKCFESSSIGDMVKKQK